jgi:hypothetical protein
MYKNDHKKVHELVNRGPNFGDEELLYFKMNEYRHISL